MNTKTQKEENKVINIAESMNWYAIRVQNNRERSVLEKIQIEARFLNLTDRIGRTMIPTEKSLTVKNGKKVFKEKIVYPGYIFIETSAKGEVQNILKNIKGASGFVRSRSGEVSPMKEYEVRKILSEQEMNDELDLSSLYVVDEIVEIVDGPFSTFKGKITKVENDKDKVKVEVTIFGRATEVELSFNQINKK